MRKKWEMMFIFSWDELALEGSPEQHEGGLARNITAKKNENSKWQSQTFRVTEGWREDEKREEYSLDWFLFI